MSKETNIKEAVEEIKAGDEETLQKVVEDWFERTRMDGMKLGARFISAAVYGTIQKHLKKGAQSSLRDYRRMADEILDIISVQLKQDNTIQNDSEESNENQEGEV